MVSNKTKLQLHEFCGFHLILEEWLGKNSAFSWFSLNLAIDFSISGIIIYEAIVINMLMS